jgi:hypothetical protein
MVTVDVTYQEWHGFVELSKQQMTGGYRKLR